MSANALAFLTSHFANVAASVGLVGLVSSLHISRQSSL
jgi:hypothetical protein